MKGILTVLGVIILLAIGWLLFFDTNSNEYEILIDEELTSLETDLAAIETQVAAGTLSEQAAISAQSRISQRLMTLSTTLPSGGDLSNEQRSALNDGLARLKDIITRYQTTLLAVDEAAGTDNRSVLETAVEAVEDIQEVVETGAEDLMIEDVDVFLDEVSESTEALEDLEVDATTTTTTATSTATTTDTGEDTETATTTEADKEPIINPDLEATTSAETAV